MMEYIEKSKSAILVLLVALLGLAYMSRPVQHTVRGYGMVAPPTTKVSLAKSQDWEVDNAINQAVVSATELNKVVESHAKNLSYLNWWLTRLFVALAALAALVIALVALVATLVRKIEELQSVADDAARGQMVLKKLAGGQQVTEAEYKAAFGDDRPAAQTQAPPNAAAPANNAAQQNAAPNPPPATVQSVVDRIKALKAIQADPQTALPDATFQAKLDELVKLL